MTADLGLVRHTSEIPAQCLPAALLIVVKEHSGIVHQIRFGDHNLLALRAFHQKRCDAVALVPLGKERVRVWALEVILQYLFQRSFPFFMNIRNISRPVLREAEVRLLVLHNERLVGQGDKPVGASVIISPEYDLEATIFKGQLVVVLPYLGLLVGHGLHGSVGGTDSRAPKFGFRSAVNGTVRQRHRQA